MKQYLASAVVYSLVVAAVAVAQTPPPTDPTQPGRARVVPVQSKVVPAQPAQPGGFTARVTPARVAALEEEFETLEAHRDVKRAYVRAAEVALKGTEANLGIVTAGNAAPQAEVVKAKIEVEAAKAQLEIRMAELKEVEVKIKHAKKRLEDAKAGGVRQPGVRPVDPPPPPPLASAEELNRKLKDLQSSFADKKAAAIKAPVEARQAKEELERVLEVAKRGRVRPGTIEAAEEKVKAAQDKADKAVAELKKLEDEIAVVQAKLKEIEK